LKKNESTKRTTGPLAYLDGSRGKCDFDTKSDLPAFSVADFERERDELATGGPTLPRDFSRAGSRKRDHQQPVLLSFESC
jgi:hypothetical protein